MEWGLPCHSLILSSRSPVSAASHRNAECTRIDKTEDGKRIVRLPLDEESATYFLQYCYGVLTQSTKLPWTAAIPISVVSNMLGMPGELPQMQEVENSP